jgi:hypothetical protein
MRIVDASDSDSAYLGAYSTAAVRCGGGGGLRPTVPLDAVPYG